MRYAVGMALLVGCSGPTDPGGPGFVMEGYFPFDGDRTWRFLNDDQAVPYRLIGRMSNTEGSNGRYTVAFERECVTAGVDCTDGPRWSTTWSSDATDGVFLHAWSLEGGAETALDPPLQVSDARAERGEVMESDTAGTHFTSTLERLEACPVAMAADFDTCARISISADSGEVPPLTGTYWAASGFNVVAMELAWDEGRWELSNHDCQGCDGQW